MRFAVVRASDPLAVAADLLVVPVHAGEEASQLRPLDRRLGGTLVRHARDVGFRGQEGRGLLHRLAGERSRFRTVYLAGLGDRRRVTLETWRRAGGAAVGAGRSDGASRLVAWLDEPEPERAVALAEGARLATYRFTRYRRPEKDACAVPNRLTLAGPHVHARTLGRDLEEVTIVADAVCAARDLVNEPPSVKSAAHLARRAVEMCRGTAVRVEVMGPRQIRALRLAGLLAVNRGSTEEPRFVRLAYRPPGRARRKVALVGKGITFDSGGLSLKPPASMETQKQDMSGAAAVFAAMAAIGRLGPDVAVTGYVPSTDNLPSGSAQKPGDVIRYRNGKTVEVLNTDAEGRLVLADALCLASEAKPDVIIDLATLTAACRVALGLRVAGIMGNDERLVDRLVEHGRDAGEPLWPLPLVADYRDELKSSVADLKNVGGGGFAGAIIAGLFLQEFVDGADWAHLDIAGPAFTDRDLAYCPRGGTGFGVRTLVRYLMSL